MSETMPGVVYMYDPPDIHFIYGWIDGEWRTSVLQDAYSVDWDMMVETYQFRSYCFWLGMGGAS